MFKKNPDYWDAKNIHIDAVELTSAPDASTVVNGLRTGVYNFADIEPSQAEAAKKAGLDVFVQPGFNAANISLNVNKAPFDNPKVVDAVRHAVNRKEFVDKLTFGYGEETDQPFPKDYVAYDPKSENAYPYDPAKSKKLLAQAGYRPHQLKLNLVIPSEDPQAEIVQSQLARSASTSPSRSTRTGPPRSSPRTSPSPSTAPPAATPRSRRSPPTSARTAR